MSIPDILNGSFETLGGAFLLLNCRRVWKDKSVKGVSILATSFFAGWGLWNLYYYPSLHQWFSFWGGCATVSANLLWIVLMVAHRPKGVEK